MSNNCYTNVNVKGEPKNIIKFLDYLIFEEEEGNKKGKYLARTFIDYTSKKDFIEEHKEEIKNGDLNFLCWCAWSCWSCWFEGYPNGEELLTLKEVCDICKVNVLADSEETGMCFEESLGCINGKIYYSSREMPTWTCEECGNEQSFPSYYSETDLEDEICYECDKETKWRKNE